MLGILQIDKAAGGEYGPVRARLVGPRGGYIGDTVISRENAREAIERLDKFAGRSSEPISKFDTLIDAAVAVLDSEGGIASMGELAAAVKALGGGDFTTDYPNVAKEA